MSVTESTQVEFYHHARADGGTRTGLRINNARGLEYYHENEEADEFDPRLLWSIDVRTTSTSLLQTPRQARAWLKENTQHIRTALIKTAEAFRIGIDDDGSYGVHVYECEAGIFTVVVGGAGHWIRRDLGLKIEQLLDDFESLTKRLKPYKPLTL